MKILLVQARTDNPEGPVFPLGLASLASNLPPDWTARAVDMNAESDPAAALLRESRTFRPDLIGFSLRNIKVARPGEHADWGREVKQLVRQVKSIFPGKPLIAGGSGFSLYAETLMNSVPELDFGFIGEGEKAFPGFLRQFPDPAGIPGLAFRRGSRVVLQGKAPAPDLAPLPWPRRDLFPMEIYRQFPTAVGVMTKRGCPFRCIHCSDLYLLGEHLRLRDPGDVIEELRFLQREYGISHFMFADPTFNVPVEHTKQLLRLICRAGLGLRWTAYFTPLGLDREMADLFRESGCFLVSFSPDTCDPGMLTRLGKGFSLADLHRAGRLLRRVGLPVTYNFMLGLPGESFRSLLRTLFFVVTAKIRLRRLFQLHGLFMVPVRIYPHTVLREIAIREGRITANDDLLQPRFSRSPGRFLHLADQAVMKSIAGLWKIKHLAEGSAGLCSS